MAHSANDHPVTDVKGVPLACLPGASFPETSAQHISELQAEHVVSRWLPEQHNAHARTHAHTHAHTHTHTHIHTQSLTAVFFSYTERCGERHHPCALRVAAKRKQTAPAGGLQNRNKKAGGSSVTYVISRVAGNRKKKMRALPSGHGTRGRGGRRREVWRRRRRRW